MTVGLTSSLSQMKVLLGISFCFDLEIYLFLGENRHSGLEMLSHRSFFVKTTPPLKASSFYHILSCLSGIRQSKTNCSQILSCWTSEAFRWFWPSYPNFLSYAFSMCLKYNSLCSAKSLSNVHWQSIFCFLCTDLNARINKIKSEKPKFWPGSHSQPCMTQFSSEDKLIKQTLPAGNQLSYLLVCLKTEHHSRLIL